MGFFYLLTQQSTMNLTFIVFLQSASFYSSSETKYISLN